MSTLKKINVSDLVIGVYFCGFDGAWIDNPFWRKSFLLEDTADLLKAKSAGFSSCWIDPMRGKDVSSKLPPLPAEVDATDVHPSRESDRELDEKAQAKRIYDSAKQATQAMFNQVRLGKAIDVQNCRSLIEEISNSVNRNSGALISLLRLKDADEYTFVHSVAVCALMVALGKTLGLDDFACKEAGFAGYLHDIGKAFIPLEILNKPGKLTHQEYRTIQNHPYLGYEYLKGDADIPDFVSEACLHHHEKVDGSGYPDHQHSGAISLYARMAAICDVYDALTSDRPYKEGWDPAGSIAQMASWKGHFDHALLLAFVKTIGIYPIGSIVRLASGRQGVVISQNEQDLTRPTIRLVSNSTSPDGGAYEVMDLSSPEETDSIAERGVDDDWSSLKHISKDFILSRHS